MCVSLWLVHEFLKCKDPLDEGRLVFFRAVCTGNVGRTKDAVPFFDVFLQTTAKSTSTHSSFFSFSHYCQFWRRSFLALDRCTLTSRRVENVLTQHIFGMKQFGLCQSICWPTHEFFSFFCWHMVIRQWKFVMSKKRHVKHAVWTVKTAHHNSYNWPVWFFLFFSFIFPFGKNEKTRKKMIKFQRTARPQ